jgi:phosphonate transport system substrate-binding protein
MRRLWGLVLLTLGLLAACQPSPSVVEVTRLLPQATAVATPIPTIVEVKVEVTRIVTETVTVVEEKRVVAQPPPPGSAERPFQLLFAPVVESAVLSRRAQVLADWLTQASGQQFQVGIVDDEQVIIELMCAAPEETIGFLTAVGVALAAQQCGAQVVNTAVQEDGFSWQAGMIVVRRDSNIETLVDLAGKRWAVPDEASIANYQYFRALLAAQGIEPGEIVVVPGDNTAMLAVYNGEVDFATGSYVPPILPYSEREWQFGEDDPELWRRTGVSPSRSGIGYVIVIGRPENGGYRVRDVRSGIFDSTRGIFDETRIIALSAPIPADSVAVSGDFPFGLARRLGPLLVAFADSDLCVESLCATDFYGWIGLETAVAANYDPLYFVIETLGWTDETLLFSE